MMIILRLFEVSAPVPAAFEEFLDNGMRGGEGAFCLRAVNGLLRGDESEVFALDSGDFVFIMFILPF